MTETEYIKIYTGSSILVQLIKQRLEEAGINPIVKDEGESGRLGGFGTSSSPELYVHESETDKAVHIVEAVRAETEA